MASRQFNPFVFPPTSLRLSKLPALYPGLGAVELADSYDWEMTNALEVNVTRRVGSRADAALQRRVDEDHRQSARREPKGRTDRRIRTTSTRIAALPTSTRRCALPARPTIRCPKFHVNSMRWRHSSMAGRRTPSSLRKAVCPSPSPAAWTTRNPASAMTWASTCPASALRAPPALARSRSGSTPQPSRRIRSLRLPTATPVVRQRSAQLSARTGYRGHRYFALQGHCLREHRIHGQFQAEAFNAWNHTNFANPASSASSGTFGTITATSSSTGSVNITVAGRHAARVAVCGEDHLLGSLHQLGFSLSTLRLLMSLRRKYIAAKGPGSSFDDMWSSR